MQQSLNCYILLFLINFIYFAVIVPLQEHLNANIQSW